MSVVIPTRTTTQSVVEGTTPYSYSVGTRYSPSVYRPPKTSDNNVWWILLSAFLALGIVIVIFLWVFTCSQTCDENNNGNQVCFGDYGLQLNTDGNAIRSCGSSRNEPCSFTKVSLADCVEECDSLDNICSAFTYNAQTATMKIINLDTQFTSAGTNLFVRQTSSLS